MQQQYIQYVLGFFVICLVVSNVLYPHKITNKTYYQCPRITKMDALFKNILNQDGYYSLDDNTPNWSLYLPCGYKTSSEQLKEIKPQITNKHQIIGLIKNNYLLGSKKWLWLTLTKSLGRKAASQIMPECWILPKDKSQFLHYYHSHPNQLYILKSEAHRQEGLKLTKNLHEILASEGTKYRVIQKYLDYPSLYQGHKYNFRIYLLMTTHHRQLKAWVYPDGIISYTPEPYQSHTNSSYVPLDEETICSYYKSHPLYEKGFPPTTKTLFKQMNNHQTKKMWNKCLHQIKQVINASKSGLGHPYPNNKCFQLFGVDFFIDRDLNPSILEVNMGPGMDPKTNIDKAMRTRLLNDQARVLGLVRKPTKCEFIRIV